MEDWGKSRFAPPLARSRPPPPASHMMGARGACGASRQRGDVAARRWRVGARGAARERSRDGCGRAGRGGAWSCCASGGDDVLHQPDGAGRRPPLPPPPASLVRAAADFRLPFDWSDRPVWPFSSAPWSPILSPRRPLEQCLPAHHPKKRRLAWPACLVVGAPLEALSSCWSGRACGLPSRP